MTLFCPFWEGQEETVFQLQKLRGVPPSEMGGVLSGTCEVGGADQTAALIARVDAFWLRWEKEACSDMSRKVEAEARKLAKGEDVAPESCAAKKIFRGPWEEDRRPPPPPPQGARIWVPLRSPAVNGW